MIYVAPDTNVLLHACSLAELPWGEIADDDVCILITGPVNREIDKFKVKGGRIGKRAKAVYALIRGAYKSESHTKILREKAPCVTLKIVPGTGVHGKLHDCLDLTNPDHQLVNHCLALVKQGIPVQLVTHDIGACLDAKEANLEAFLIEDHWLLPAESNEEEKQIKRLEAEIKRLQLNEPKIAAAFYGNDGKPVQRLSARLCHYPPLRHDQIEALVDRASELCPPAIDFGPDTEAEALAQLRKKYENNPLAEAMNAISLKFDIAGKRFEPASKQQIETYRSDRYPAWRAEMRKVLEKLHLHLEKGRTVPQFEFVASNSGRKPAESPRFDFAVRGGLRIGRTAIGDAGESGPSVAAVLSVPPEPPKGKFVSVFGIAEILNAPFLPLDDVPMWRKREFNIPNLISPDHSTADPSGFHWTEKRGEPVTQFTAHRSTWRHQAADLRETLFIDSDQASGTVIGAVELRISAHNLPDMVKIYLPITIEIEEGNTHQIALGMVEDLPKRVRAQPPT